MFVTPPQVSVILAQVPGMRREAARVGKYSNIHTSSVHLLALLEDALLVRMAVVIQNFQQRGQVPAVEIVDEMEPNDLCWVN